ncbi:hypothetical protein [Streptomyces halobius]|uniref:Uncharacterized protein n=1 Tax=Streptomyces halobius TaxID=2879846 RepID=A0ABY4M488_9ACTN|nr:hypothetical protein [Streptomyces halobius]UQA92577.1 hypothetical protein K9S39_12745 [Streptomyces halobius]
MDSAAEQRDEWGGNLLTVNATALSSSTTAEDLRALLGEPSDIHVDGRFRSLEYWPDIFGFLLVATWHGQRFLSLEANYQERESGTRTMPPLVEWLVRTPATLPECRTQLRKYGVPVEETPPDDEGWVLLDVQSQGKEDPEIQFKFDDGHLYSIYLSWVLTEG